MSLKYKDFYDVVKSSPDLIPQVIKLDFYNSELEEIPEEINLFKNLEILDISKNKITNIPKLIKNLTKLKQLNCSQNKIVYFPDELCELKNLESLVCVNNEIKAFPKSFGNITNLKMIYCGDNKLFEFPSSFFDLNNLEILRFDNNNITHLNNFNRLEHLTTLTCFNNPIEVIPPEIEQCVFLQKIIALNYKLITIDNLNFDDPIINKNNKCINCSKFTIFKANCNHLLCLHCACSLNHCSNCKSEIKNLGISHEKKSDKNVTCTHNNCNHKN